MYRQAFQDLRRTAHQLSEIEHVRYETRFCNWAAQFSRLSTLAGSLVTTPMAVNTVLAIWLAGIAALGAVLLRLRKCLREMA